ncbi:sulfite exporter TauE/SafE family protein [Roseobacteraceae bacterium S113]
MSWEVITFVTLGALAGGFINGLAGTGTALFALGFFLVVLEPVAAVAVVAMLAVISGLQGLWIVRGEIGAQPRRLARFVLPGLVGVPLGVLLLDVVDASLLRWSVALFLIVYGAYFGLRANLPAFERPTPLIDSGIGFTGGVLGGVAGLSGALPTLWVSVRPWSKGETRAVLQPYNAVMLVTTVGLLAFRGAYSGDTLLALALALLVGLAAAQIGIATFKRLSDTAFRRLLILLCLAMGLGIAAGELASAMSS